MSPESALLWWWLNILTRKRYAVLKERFGSLDDALAALSPDLLQSIGLRDDTVQRVFVRLQECDPAALLQRMHSMGISVISLEDAAYPRLLKEVPDAPVFLSYAGDLTLLDQPAIAVVGTRGMTSYGQRITEEMVPQLVAAGVVTVSGLARGVDALVARETLRANGRTVAIPGGSLFPIYPQQNARLAKEILQQGGLLISELPLDILPEKYAFPARNRVIAGTTLTTVVVEAPLQSGALITARLAAEYNRNVCAVPGPVFEPACAGCNALIAGGEAQLVVSAKDVLQMTGMEHAVTDRQMSVYEPQTEDERVLCATLTSMPQHTDALVQKTHLPPDRLGVALTMLEIAGAAKQVGAGAWIRL